MDFKLIWSESSIEDLGAIVRFIALRDGSDLARQIGFGIYDRAQVLTRHPEAGSVLAEKQDASWRRLIFKSWKIATGLIEKPRPYMWFGSGMQPEMRSISND